MSTNSLKYIIYQVNQNKFNKRYYPIFDDICSSLNSINNESNWIFSINIQLPSNKEENLMLAALLLHYMSHGITHFQILKNNE
jgi:hypothetical protein